MTISTQTAPITADEAKAIKSELARMIADNSAIKLPEAFGCSPDVFAKVEEDLDDAARELLKRIPSPNRLSVLGLAVSRAIGIRADAAKHKQEEARSSRQV